MDRPRSAIPLARLLGELEARGLLRPADGVQILGTAALLRRPFDPGLPLLLLPAAEELTDGAAAADAPVDLADRVPFEPSVLPGRAAHGRDAAHLIRALYPPHHPVIALDGGRDTTVAVIAGSDLESAPYLLPPLERESNVASPHGLPWLVARLRAPGGCPWDREQTHLTLRKFLLEEAYEVYDALEAGATPALAEELGDLLLQVILHAHYAEEEGIFDLTDVYRGIMGKIVRRHPHVFGDVVARTADDVIRNWETIKAGERRSKASAASADAVESVDSAHAPEPGASGDSGESGVSAERRESGVSEQPGVPRVTGESAGPETAAAFRGLSRSLPALLYAQEMQERAASLGYDWPDIEGVIDKLEEEAVELLGASDPAQREDEYGDLLLVVVNLGRKLGIDAEAALRAASRKFGRRFALVERMAAEQGVELRHLTFEELDDLWRAAKIEAATPAATREGVAR